MPLKSRTRSSVAKAAQPRTSVGVNDGPQPSAEQGMRSDI
jgi:hypothetical protein